MFSPKKTYKIVSTTPEIPTFQSCLSGAGSSTQEEQLALLFAFTIAFISIHPCHIHKELVSLQVANIQRRQMGNFDALNSKVISISSINPFGIDGLVKGRATVS